MVLQEEKRPRGVLVIQFSTLIMYMIVTHVFREDVTVLSVYPCSWSRVTQARTFYLHFKQTHPDLHFWTLKMHMYIRYMSVWMHDFELNQDTYETIHYLASEGMNWGGWGSELAIIFYYKVLVSKLPAKVRTGILSSSLGHVFLCVFLWCLSHKLGICMRLFPFSRMGIIGFMLRYWAKLESL